jgi:hypothetical protein
VKAILLAKSSHGDPYKVEFSAEDDGLRIFCHCQAGVLHRMCKHKRAFIEGDIRMLFDPAQTALLSEIRSWPQFQNVQKHLEASLGELSEIENARRELDKKEKQIKAELGKGLSFGFRAP